MGSVKAIMGTRRNGIWVVTLYLAIGVVERGEGTTFSEALGRALGRVPSC